MPTDRGGRTGNPGLIPEKILLALHVELANKDCTKGDMTYLAKYFV